MPLSTIFPWLATAPLTKTAPQQAELPAANHDNAVDAVHVEHLFYACEKLLDMAIYLLQHQASSERRLHQMAHAYAARDESEAARRWEEDDHGA